MHPLSSIPVASPIPYASARPAAVTTLRFAGTDTYQSSRGSSRPSVWKDVRRSAMLVLLSIMGSVGPAGYYVHTWMNGQEQRIELLNHDLQIQRETNRKQEARLREQSQAFQQETDRLEAENDTLQNRLASETRRLRAQTEAVRRQSGRQISALQKRNRELSASLEQLREQAELQLSDVIEQVAPLNVRVQGKDGFGSGVWIRQGTKLYVLTNHHVTENNSLTDNGSATYRIRLYNGSDVNPATEVGSRLVFESANHDLALLEITDPDFSLPANTPTLRFRDTAREPLRLGERVFMVGTPRGLNDNVTVGVISHLERHMADFEPNNIFLGTDAAINPGNSGGALFDEEGRLIGINTAMRRNSQGLAFSIRIDVVKRVLEGWGIDI